jgi:alpha-L-rhamnosidase
VARFEAGLLDSSDWSASWIGAPLLPDRRETWEPVALLRREFVLTAVPEEARAYATALGLYRLWLNGTEVTADELLRPGWTDYSRRVLHQTFDVTALLRPGRNVVAVELARGWYAGRLGLQRQPAFYGEQPLVRVQLESRDDGARLTETDASWRWASGSVLASDLLQGEVQDLRQDQRGWQQPGFDDSGWQAVEVQHPAATLITPQPHDAPRRYREFEGRVVRQHARGPVVFDFGQNLVGWTRVRTPTLPRADLIVRHGEILTDDDLLWRDNLRGAFQEDRYTTGSAEQQELEPRFTLHGFRYAEVWGLPSADEYGIFRLRDDTSIQAVAIDGGIAPAGSFRCSDERLDRLSSAVEWTIRDNFIEVITDCPQRDERLGWLGDAGVIAPTASDYFDIGAFVSKFVLDATDSQAENGALRDYAPVLPPASDRVGAPGWADGFVRLVHLSATRYGDLVTARRSWDALLRYAEFLDRSNPSGIRVDEVGADFSDWLSLPEDPDEPPHPGYAYTGARSTSSKPVIATAHSVRTFDQLAELAALLGHEDHAARFRQRADAVREAYRHRFVDASGRIECDTQTAYAQAIGYRILNGADLDRAVARLAEKVREQGYATTGIHGVEHILPALAEHGQADLAFDLLLRDAAPGWLHMIERGATTIWEKWDGIDGAGRLSTAEMNSFNHCALGAVGEFLFHTVAGLDARTVVWDSTVVVAPRFAAALDWAEAVQDTPAGRASVHWVRGGTGASTGGGAGTGAGAGIRLSVNLDPGLRAEVRVPAGYRVVGSAAGERLSLPAGRHTLELALTTAPE